MSVEKVFKTVDDNSNGIMDVTEFNEAVSLCYRELSKHEVDVLFKHFDKRGVGTITKEEFNKGLNETMNLEARLRFTLHDFITPLQTLTRARNLTPSTIFDLFALGKQSLSLI